MVLISQAVDDRESKRRCIDNHQMDPGVDPRDPPGQQFRVEAPTVSPSKADAVYEVYTWLAAGKTRNTILNVGTKRTLQVILSLQHSFQPRIKDSPASPRSLSRVLGGITKKRWCLLRGRIDKCVVNLAPVQAHAIFT